MPAGQLEQLVELYVLEYFPPGHWEQALAPRWLKVPGPQGVHSAARGSGAKLPAGHGVQLDVVVTLPNEQPEQVSSAIAPGKHGTQLVLLVVEGDAGHATHLSAVAEPRTEVRPTGQTEHMVADEAPTAVLNEPLGQGWHTPTSPAAATVPNVPAEHDWQAAADVAPTSELKAPAGQDWQADAPGDALKVPAGQSLHIVDPAWLE